MSLEGRLRDLGLQELCQLLTLSRKSGTLHISAQLEGRAAAVVFHQGAIVDAWQRDGGDIGVGRDAKTVEATFFALLTWRDGTFVFAPASPDTPPPATGVRLGTESMLVEATRRADGWAELADRIPHSSVVPAFVDVEPRQLPLLHLVPQEWEILTRVDGQRDLPALAHALGRDVLEVARIVHGLIGTGLLTLRDVAPSARALPTPPSVRAMLAEPRTPDLWIPGAVHVALTAAEDDGDHDDMIFDPISVGVLTPDGLPRLRTPMYARVTPEEARPAISEHASATSVNSSPTPAVVCSNARVLGDEAARRGDLAGALTHWNEHLRLNEQAEDADQVREAIALAARLHALLHSASPI